MRHEFEYYLNGTIPLTVEVNSTSAGFDITSVTDAGGTEFDDLAKVGEYKRVPGGPDLGKWVSLDDSLAAEVDSRSKAWRDGEVSRDRELAATNARDAAE